VLIEGFNEEICLLSGRTSFQAPDIDGITYIAKGKADTAEMVEAKITDASAYNLYAEIKSKAI